MRLKLLNGAPLCEQLDFGSSALLKAADCDGFDAKRMIFQSEDAHSDLKWREIEARTVFRTGWSQLGTNVQCTHNDQSFIIPGVEEASALPEYDVTNHLDTTLMLDDESAVADDYLQHSLVFYDTLLSSQVVQDQGRDDTVDSSSFLTNSFTTTASGSSSASPVNKDTLVLQLPSTMNVTSLGSLPSARHLRTIYPQTPTPNFLCALMTTPERREISVRKGGYKMDLWEITVGDDTCPAFKVTFWLRPSRNSTDPNPAQSQLLQALEHLAIGNIILLRNIALTSFRDIVYGQSLNTAISRARTSVVVLAEGTGTSVAQLSGLPASVSETFTRVKRWARLHIAGESYNTRKRKGDSTRKGNAAKRFMPSSARDEYLPPDTMESP